MAQPLGPWRPPSPQRHTPQQRWLIRIGIILAFGLAIWALSAIFPGAISRKGDLAGAAYYAMWGALLASGLVVSRQVSVGHTLRNIALWLGIFAILAIAYMLKDPFQQTWLRLQSQLISGSAIETAPREVTINADENGDFYVWGSVNGATVRFAVDTGASDIVLSPADARRAGIDIAGLTYGGEYETANGTGHGAFVTLEKFSVGPISFVEVPASVNATAMDSSLLGMAFLKRLKSFEFSKDKLVLHY
ncbi:MAG TPA: TIGR02281 family clan AA aspartic protease [Rhizomicrobium sp.]|nr:TIGR02281 family clan AA aspartic protease [Rhizomicrobium sp.]